MRAPLARPSTLRIISALKGPPSSLSCGWEPRGAELGSKEEGVLGIGTAGVVGICRWVASGSLKGGPDWTVIFVRFGLGGLLIGLAEGVAECEGGCDAECVAECCPTEPRRPSRWPFGDCCRTSLRVWNLDMSSLRVVAETPLLLLPF